METGRKEREEPNSFLKVKVVTDKTFSCHEGFDLAIFDERSWPHSILPTFLVLKQETYSVFKSRVARRFRYPETQFRLWVLVNRQNKTVRPGMLIPEINPSSTIEEIHRDIALRLQRDLLLYLDFFPGPSMKNHLKTTGTVMVFLKKFDTTRQKFNGIGRIHVQKASKVRDLIPIINKRMRWEFSTPLRLYEEVKPGMIMLLKPTFTLTQSEIQDGDIICVQAQIPDAEIRQLESQGLYSNPPQLYDYLHDRVTVLFKPKFDDPEVSQPEFSLVLSRKQNYEVMASKVGEFLKHDPTKLRFTTTFATTGTPKSIVKRSLVQSIDEMVYPFLPPPPRSVILYERLSVSIVKLETKRTLIVVWTGIDNREKSTHLFLMSRTCLVNELIHRLSTRVQLTPTGIGGIRMFMTTDRGRTREDLRGYEMVGNIPNLDPVVLFAEEIPREEIEAKDRCKVIDVFHFTGDPWMTHGVPFKLIVKPWERLAETKKRLQLRLGISETDSSNLRFALVQTAPTMRVSHLKDDDIIHERESAPDDLLGLDYAEKPGYARGGDIGPWMFRDAQAPVELFAEEIPREDSRAEGHDHVTDIFRFTRDVARTHGIEFKFGFPAGFEDCGCPC